MITEFRDQIIYQFGQHIWWHAKFFTKLHDLTLKMCSDLLGCFECVVNLAVLLFGLIGLIIPSILNT